MSKDRPIIDYFAAKPVSSSFRPGFRAVAAIAFSGAFWMGLLTFVLARKFALSMMGMWTSYVAAGLALLGAIFAYLTYRKSTGRKG